MRYDNEQKARTRARILSVASAALRVHGVSGVSISTIMAAAGLTHGGFYAHFKSRDELIAQVITHTFDERYANFLSLVDMSDPTSALNNFIDNYLSMRHRDDVKGGCPLPALVSETPRLSVAARSRFNEGTQRLMGNIADLLARIGYADADSHASSVLAEMVGALTFARAARNRKDASAILYASKTRIIGRLGLPPANLHGRSRKPSRGTPS